MATPELSPTPTRASRAASVAIAALAIFGLVACDDDPETDESTSTSSTSGTGGGGAGGASGGAGGAGGVDPGYPPPPYGNEVGNVFPALAWEGHVNLEASAPASSQPYVDWTSDDLRTAGTSHALVHLAATF